MAKEQAEPKGTITFAHLGIGTVLKNYWLEVPDNQREYKWEEKHVNDLLQDLTDAIQSTERRNYFLGTIVVTPGEGSKVEVADGQQRLATTSILLAAIRDWLHEHGHHKPASAIDDPLLSEYNHLILLYHSP